MLTFKKILVPFDGSEHAKRALAKAVSLAQCCDGAKLYIITVDEDVSALSMNRSGIYRQNRRPRHAD